MPPCGVAAIDHPQPRIGRSGLEIDLAHAPLEVEGVLVDVAPAL